jgi:cytochrome c oxidase subunit 3
MLIFLGAEAMLFAGLMSAFIVLRAGSAEWPPVGQPRLPVEITGINTLFLLISGYAIHRALKSIRLGDAKRLNQWLIAAGGLGGIFLGIQGAEWVRLIGYGLTMTSSLYGGMFYTLIGCHALHVSAGMIGLLVVIVRALEGKYTKDQRTGVELCSVYWHFVVGVWPILYVVVYLT